jgi:hypothetical protein
MRATFANTVYKLIFAECRSAMLDPGSEYWAVEVVFGADRNIIGSSVQRYCEEAAQQQRSIFARCAPVNLRYLTP